MTKMMTTTSTVAAAMASTTKNENVFFIIFRFFRFDAINDSLQQLFNKNSLCFYFFFVLCSLPSVKQTHTIGIAHFRFNFHLNKKNLLLLLLYSRIQVHILDFFSSVRSALLYGNFSHFTRTRFFFSSSSSLAFFSVVVNVIDLHGQCV